jgi:hypothetical protein
LSYTYDYTKSTTGESAARRYWRAMKMTLTRSVRAKTFQFDGREYEYLYHPYNRTWKNERGVEIPIFRELLLKHEGKRVLEVGNVLSHYFPIHHEVIDKYEVSSGVINQDIVEFVPQLLQAIDHLRSTCLAPSGQLVASLPIGYNRYFDYLQNNGKSPFTTQHFLKRISKQNYWVESDWNGCKDATYGRFVAHAIVIGTIQG